MNETHSFRIAPTNALIIEWRRKQDGARWCFFRICDGKPEAKRIYRHLEHGIVDVDGDALEQPMLLELP